MSTTSLAVTQPSPSPASAQHSFPPSISTRNTTPDPSIDQERSSSDTQTIFTIYSMYGDDNPDLRAMWPASEGTNTILDGKDPRVSDLSDSPLSSRCSVSDIAQDDILSDMQPHGQFLALSNGFLASNGTRRLQTKNTIDPGASTHLPNTTTTISSQPTLRQSRDLRNIDPCRSRPHSNHILSNRSREPSPTQNGNLRSSASAELVTNLPRINVVSTSHSSPIRSPNASSDTSLLKPSKNPPRPPKPKHTFTSPMSSLSSKTSLVPFEGEDPDAFHIRNTYAQLEECGVKGDGYEEGVERTRARIGDSTTSQIDAERALGDGTEKTQALSAKELEVLASVDRYGFFDTPSHDRLVLLPSAPLLKPPSRTRAGPSNAPTSAESLPSVPPTHVLPKESLRIAKWSRMLRPLKRDVGGNVEAWCIKPPKLLKFRERTYKGIPDRWRSAVWELLVSQATKSEKKDVDALEDMYREEQEKPSSYDIQIDLDVPRTISGHVMFRTRYGAGQRSLFHVLHCFSLHCSDCGYVQGMGPIAATLLCYFPPPQVYAILVRLHSHPLYSLHAIFLPGFPGLLEAIYIQERIIERIMPDVYSSFKKNMISTTSYATKWYITLFANTVPFQCQLRLWDVFLLEGKDAFIAVAVAIIWVYRDHLTSSEANFETILSLLSSVFVPEDDDALLMWMERFLSDKKLRQNMERWRKEWNGLVSSGKSTTALL